MVIQNCPKLSLKGWKVKLLHLPATKYWPPRKGHDLTQGSSGSEAIANGWRHSQWLSNKLSLPEWEGQGASGSIRRVRKHLSLHVQSLRLGELAIIIGNYHDFRNIPWVSAWLLRMHDVWGCTRRKGGWAAECQATLCSSASRATPTKSWSHLLARGWGGGVIMGKREAVSDICLVFMKNIAFGQHETARIILIVSECASCQMGRSKLGIIFLPHSLTNKSIFCNTPNCDQAKSRKYPSPTNFLTYLQQHWPQHSCHGEFAAQWLCLSIWKPESFSCWHTFHSPLSWFWRSGRWEYSPAADLYFFSEPGDSHWLVGWMILSLCFKWLEWVSACSIYHSRTVTRGIRSTVFSVNPSSFRTLLKYTCWWYLT